MFVVRSGSAKELRFFKEEEWLGWRLRRLVQRMGGKVDDDDCFDPHVEKLNYRLALDIVGLIGLKVEIGGVYATLITAPGEYFDPCAPERRALLDALCTAMRAQGRLAVVISKQAILDKTRIDLASAPPLCRGRHETADRLLSATGRRTELQHPRLTLQSGESQEQPETPDPSDAGDCETVLACGGDA